MTKPYSQPPAAQPVHACCPELMRRVSSGFPVTSKACKNVVGSRAYRSRPVPFPDLPERALALTCSEIQEVPLEPRHSVSREVNSQDS